MSSLSYKDAGVNLELYDQTMLKLPELMARTHSRRVLPLEGGFAGLFRLQDESHTYQDPVLVSGTDGVGTKIRVAQLARRYDTIGIDLVAMCVNDCLCVGAQPLFFLDYLAMAQDDPEQHFALVKGVRDGCLLAQAALIGGETAIMPGLYAPGDFDLAGFCVAVVERTKVIDGSRIRPGDVLIGVASTGLHSNGFSLVRKAVFDSAGLTVEDHVVELGASVGDVLLTPTCIYTAVVSGLLRNAELAAGIGGIAHITGGGLADNLARILPPGCRAVVDRGRWSVPSVFSWVQKLGNVDREEMYRVFNMGIGLVLVCRSELQQPVQEAVAELNLETFPIGDVVSGNPEAVYLN